MCVGWRVLGGMGGWRRRRCLDLANFTGNYHEIQSYTLKEWLHVTESLHKSHLWQESASGLPSPMCWSKGLLGVPSCAALPNHQQLSTVTLPASWLHVPVPHTHTASLGAPMMNPSIFPYRPPKLFHWESKSGSGLYDLNRSSAFQPGP